MDTRLENGWKLFNQLHGKHTGEALINALKDISPDYVDMIADFAFGGIFAREGLDMKSRELQSVALCAAFGDMPEQLVTHLEAALQCGATKTECIETILQVCLYAGFSRVTNALMVAKRALNNI
jgi:4-carboxymuconolactone decarboxylase